MKVLHFSTGDINGGAFRGAYWLHKGLLNRGLRSKLLVLNKFSDDPTVVKVSNRPFIQKFNRLKGAIEELPVLLYKQKTQAAFSPAITAATGVRQAIEDYQPDLIHLQWVNGGLLNPKAIGAMAHIPIVWTLRDMWPFSGGCHYANDCSRYTETCGTCPILGSTHRRDLSHRLWQRKHNAWRRSRLHPVAISRWMAECAAASSLFQGQTVPVIHNAVDETLFRPLNKAFSRSVLNLSSDKKIIAFGAINAVSSERKGFSYLVSALRRLSQQATADSREVVIFGASQPQEDIDLGLKVTYLGRLKDNVTLALVYSAADVMVVPSVQEAFGKTAIEAMACATPVVSFDSTGLKDIVEHRQSGYRARCFDAADLASGIDWVLQGSEHYEQLCRRARAVVEEKFTVKHQADRYCQLYQTLLQEKQQ